jgi:hypothetical protein
MYTGDGAEGIYTGYNGAHFYPNNGTSYGPWRISGSRSGWNGLSFANNGSPHVMFSDSVDGGIYWESYGRWSIYIYAPDNRVGIGSSATSSAYRLYVSGAIYAESNIVAYSDRRAKKDIVTIDSALDKLLKLRGVYYKAIDDETQKRQAGVIAQEVNEVFPEVVTYADDVDQYGVHYGNFAGLFIEAIKEQNQIIENQKKEIEELKEIVNKLILNNKR